MFALTDHQNRPCRPSRDVAYTHFNIKVFHVKAAAVKILEKLLNVLKEMKSHTSHTKSETVLLSHPPSLTLLLL